MLVIMHTSSVILNLCVFL